MSTTTTSVKCPICDQPAVPAYKPFCSSRHRDRDLLQWLGEGYRIPGRAISQTGLDSAEDAD
ncbi:DNA gyrase inhibitor YacG [Sphingomonas aurantiaca]|nr:DNA gyrase inhibitor YacG [Sphingomonas aurantiaca]